MICCVCFSSEKGAAGNKRRSTLQGAANWPPTGGWLADERAALGLCCIAAGLARGDARKGRAHVCDGAAGRESWPPAAHRYQPPGVTRFRRATLAAHSSDIKWLSRQGDSQAEREIPCSSSPTWRRLFWRRNLSDTTRYVSMY